MMAPHKISGAIFKMDLCSEIDILSAKQHVTITLRFSELLPIKISGAIFKRDLCNEIEILPAKQDD